MLTRENFRKNFKILKFLSNLRILPLDVDCENGRISGCGRKKRRCCLVVFAIFMVHAMYVNVRLLQSLLWHTQLVRHHLILHFDVAACSLMVAGWYYLFFIKNPYVVCSVFNNLFFTKDDIPSASGPQMYVGVERPKLFRFTHSRQEYLALYVPEMVGLALVFVLAALAYDPTMKQLLFSSLSSEYQTSFWFCVIFPLEAFFLLFCVCTPIFAMIIHMLMFEKVTGLLRCIQQLTDRWGDNENELLRDYNELRSIQVLVCLFNKVNCHVIFTFKLFCIAICTTNGYSAVSHFGKNPIFGVMYYVVFVVLTTMYSILYEKAFAIPQLVSLVKSEMRQRTDTMNPKCRKELKRRLDSIPLCGIRVGNYHCLERLSTPSFIDFVIRNVVGLLMS